MKTKVHKELMHSASTEQRAGLADAIERYCEGGPACVPRNKFNGAEGWFPSNKAQDKIRLEAFTPWQLRAYGFCRSLNDRPTFFVTGIDTSKKQQRANQDVLEAAGKEAVRINTLLG